MKLSGPSEHLTLKAKLDALITREVASPDEVQGEVRALYLAHADALYAALRRLTWRGCDIEDLLQEVFVVAIRRPRALLLADSPKAWLYGVSAKVAAAACRKHRLREFLGLEAAEAIPAEASNGLETADTVAAVHRALAKLSPKKREVLVLFELQGLSGPEIAHALRCPLKTVWSRLHYARTDFERQMVRHG